MDIASFNDLLKPLDQEMIEAIYPLTPMQEGLLYHKVISDDASEYLLQQVFTIRGKFDQAKAMASLFLVSQAFDVLRTQIVYRKVSTPLQVVLSDRQIEVELVDLSRVSEQEKELARLKTSNSNRGFDLESDPLARVLIVTMGPNRTEFIWSAHHIILDGWCFPVLFQRFMSYYEALTRDETLESLAKRVNQKGAMTHYQDYVRWLSKQDHHQGLAYWNQLLADYGTVAEIQPMYQLTETTGVNQVSQSIGTEVTEQLQQLAQGQQLTINTLIETVWGLVLQSYNYSDDVVFGKVVSGRNVPLPKIEELVGLFINTIPVRVTTKPEMTLLHLLQSMQKQAIESSQFDYCSLASIQKESTLKGNLFETLVVFENYYVNEGVHRQLADLTIEAEMAQEQTNYPITLKVFEQEGLVFELIYKQELYQDVEMQSLMTKLIHYLEMIVTAVNQPLEDLRLTDSSELAEVSLFNQRTEGHSQELFIQRFESHVQTFADKVALNYTGERLTFRELNQRANQLAHFLRKKGLKRNQFVAILADRSIEMIVCILGVLKAGGAYVPLDPSFPDERLGYMLADCQPRLILTTGINYRSTLSECLNYDQLVLAGESCENPEFVNQANDLIYCIYTSGTTGRPKGVLVEQGNIRAFIENSAKLFTLNDGDVMAQFANYIFDAMIFEMATAFANGIGLCLIPEEIIADVRLFNDYCLQQGVTIAILPPAYFLQSRISCLRIILTGGSSSNLQVLKEALETSRYFNIYGPTETTVFVTSWEGNLATPHFKRPPIGRPLPNTEAYVVNKGQRCGIGQPGELWIAGDSVVRGYLNQPEINSATFIANPFDSGRVYRTGDLVRWLPDGNLDFLGRVDRQVSIRGFRVELGEIETVLRQYPRMTDAVVSSVTDQTGDQQLLAYFVAEQELDIQAVQSFIARELPDYMLPAKLLQIEEIPLNSVGKLNQAKLPEITMTSGVYVAPITEKEVAIAGCFERILGMTTISSQADFFELGGDSLKAIRLLAELRQTGYESTVKDIFQQRTIAGLAKTIDRPIESTGEVNQSLGTVKLNQEQVDQFNQLVNSQLKTYRQTLLNNPVSRRLSLSASQLVSSQLGLLNSFARIDIQSPWNSQRFSDSWQEILKSYSMLSGTINLGLKQELVEYLPDKSSKVPYIDLSDYTPSSQQEYLQSLILALSSYDEAAHQGEVLLHGIVVVQLSAQEFSVLVPISHLIFDGFSQEILSGALTDLYTQNGGIIPRDYQLYRQQVTSGLVEITEAEIVTCLELESFEESLIAYEQIFAKEAYTTFDYQLKLTKSVSAEELFELAGKVYQTALRQAFSGIDVPVFTVQTGREYAGVTFNDYLGEFLDLLPVQLLANQQLFDVIRQKVAFTAKHQVNLVSLKTEQHLKQKFSKINSLLSRIDFNDLAIPVLNVLIMYQDNRLLVDNPYEQGEQSEQQPDQPFVTTITSTGNGLSFSRLICQVGQEQEMKEFLETCFT